MVEMQHRKIAPPISRLEQVTGIEPASSAWKADALPLGYTCIFWWSIGESNPEPSGYEPDALPIELIDHFLRVGLPTHQLRLMYRALQFHGSRW